MLVIELLPLCVVCLIELTGRGRRSDLFFFVLLLVVNEE